MKPSDYATLRVKIIATTLSFSLIPLLVLGLVMYRQFETAYTSKVLGNLQTLVEDKRKVADLFLSERISQIHTLAQTTTFDEVKSPAALEALFSTIQTRSKYYIDLGVIDAEGNHVSYAGPYKLQGLNYRNEEWFEMVKRKGVWVSDVFMGFRRFPHIILAVLRREGDSFWIMRATIDSDVFEALVRGGPMSPRGDSFIINSSGVLQTSTSLGPHVLETVPPPASQRFSGPRVELGSPEGGEKRLYGMAWLDNKDWLLVVQEDPVANLLPLSRAFDVVFMAIAFGLGVIIAGIVLLTRLMIAPLIKSDRERAALDATLTQSSKMAALGKLAAGVAHEINNPLAIIKEKAGWLKDLLSEEDVMSSPNFTEFEESINKIDHHVERAKTVTHRLLGFARRMEPAQDPVDVNFVLAQTITFLENEALYRNIAIKREFDPDLPRTISDTSQLQQVFLNILDNALDSVERNGSVTIVTERLPQDGDIKIAFTDTGKGIPRDQLDKIFDPFFTTKKTGEGTGLGLAISYSIIEKLGGRIEVYSEEGHGATFTIYLPVK